MRARHFLYTSLLLLALCPLIEGSDAKSKSIEVRRFTVIEGKAFPREFSDFLYTQLIEKLSEARLFDVILGENELPDQPDGGSLVLQGTMLEARGAWYKGAGEKKLTAEVILRRRSNGTVFKKPITAGPNVWTRVSYADENELWSAGALADRIVKEIRNSLKK